MRLVRISLLIRTVTKSLRFFSGELFYKNNRKLFSCVCVPWYKHERDWENSRQSRNPQLCLGFAKLYRILPTPLVFISGYGNTENVFCCLNAGVETYWLCFGTLLCIFPNIAYSTVSRKKRTGVQTQTTSGMSPHDYLIKYAYFDKIPFWTVCFHQWS